MNWALDKHLDGARRTLGIGWTGHALLVQPSKNGSQELFFSFIFKFSFNFFKYETIVRISACSFGHSHPDPSSVSTAL